MSAGIVAVATAATAIAIVLTPAAAAPETAQAERDGFRQAQRSCSLLHVAAREIRVYRLDDDYYDYRAKGRARVLKMGKVAGCHLKVCLGEELGRGNWYGSWCETYELERGNGRNYGSFPPPYIPCSDYDGTGWFRSYVRFEGSSVTELGHETRLCKRGQPVY